MTQPVVWFEVMSNDAPRAQEFYSRLFGWRFQPGPDPSYGIVQDAAPVMGGVGASPTGTPWVTFYVGVPDLDAALAEGTKLGGKVLMPPTQLPDTRIAVIADLDGLPIGLAEQQAA